MEAKPNPSDQLWALNLVDGIWEVGQGRTGGFPTERRAHVAGVGSLVFLAANQSQVDRAVTGVIAAQRAWQQVGAWGRSDSLKRAATKLRASATALAEVLMAEVGKTNSEALGEIENAARLLEFHAGSALRSMGRSFPTSRPRTQVATARLPLGTIACITPWNFPVNLACVKIAPALATGNGIVLKPSPEASVSTTRFVECIRDCLPSGLIALVHGDGDVGSLLVRHPRINGVTFTGSSAVGRKVAVAATSRGIPVQCEMGGSNSIAVMASADLDEAAVAVSNSAFLMAGQKCTAARKVLVHEQVANELVARIVSRLDAGQFAVGSPGNADTVVGPVISDQSSRRARQAVENVMAAGATLIWPKNGLAPVQPSESTLVQPTLLRSPDTSARAIHEEIFGPVLIVVPVTSVDHAIAVSNLGEYGLVSAIYTADLREAMTFTEQVQAGTVLVNQPTTGLDFNVPFGGWGDSAFGLPEQSDSALEAFTKVQTRYVTWPAGGRIE